MEIENMSYIQDNLMPNEKILFSARVSPAIFVPTLISLVFSCILVLPGLSIATRNDASSFVYVGFLLLISGMFFLTTLKLGIDALIIMQTTEFGVTNRRVIAKTGFIHRRTLEMLLSKIESVVVYQNILGRLLNFGSVTVIGTGGTRESFRAIIEPVIVRKKINQIIESYMQSYAQYQQQRAANQS
jgi:uncharacterized membrane protein YdbT with pleckstrin-like domain